MTCKYVFRWIWRGEGNKKTAFYRQTNLEVMADNTQSPSREDNKFSIRVFFRLTYSASELSGFTCTSSLTMNEKFQYRTRPPSGGLKWGIFLHSSFESGMFFKAVLPDSTLVGMKGH